MSPSCPLTLSLPHKLTLQLLEKKTSELLPQMVFLVVDLKDIINFMVQLSVLRTDVQLHDCLRGPFIQDWYMPPYNQHHLTNQIN